MSEKRIVDLSGRSLTGQKPNEQDISLDPSVIIVHALYQPETGAIELRRSERNPPPETPNEFRVEFDNWFTVLANATAIMIAKAEKFGVPTSKMIEAVNRVIVTYLDTGGTSGRGQKIVVNTGAGDNVPVKSITQQKSVKKEEEPPALKINYDAEILAAGYSLLSSETYKEQIVRLGKSGVDKSKAPFAVEFYSSIVFRKEIISGDVPVYLEIAREKEFVSRVEDALYSKYLVALVCPGSSVERKMYWQITEPANTVEMLKKIETEAIDIATLLKSNYLCPAKPNK
jgi:hypothetical protein